MILFSASSRRAAGESSDAPPQISRPRGDNNKNTDMHTYIHIYTHIS